jgi:hypothetical protein
MMMMMTALGETFSDNQGEYHQVVSQIKAGVKITQIKQRRRSVSLGRFKN